MNKREIKVDYRWVVRAKGKDARGRVVTALIKVPTRRRAREVQERVKRDGVTEIRGNRSRCVLPKGLVESVKVHKLGAHP